MKAASSAFSSLQWPVDEILQVAIGPTTLKALVGRGFTRVAMAQEPKPEKVVDALVREMENGTRNEADYSSF